MNDTHTVQDIMRDALKVAADAGEISHARLIRAAASANGGVWSRPGLPDAAWRALTFADMVEPNPILAELTYRGPQ